MRLDIRIQKVDLPKEVDRYIARRLHFCLGRFEARIRNVTVRIFDINGPRGGADKRCRMTVRLIPSDIIVVQEVNADLFAAIDRAAERLGQAPSLSSAGVVSKSEGGRIQGLPVLQHFERGSLGRCKKLGVSATGPRFG